MSDYVVPQWLFIDIDTDFLNDLEQPFCVKYCFRVDAFSMDAPVLRHGCFKQAEMRIYCQRQRCVAHGLWFLAIGLIRYSSGIAGLVVSNESAVVENASFFFRSLCLPYEVRHWLYISKFTRLRAVFRRQHGSCFLWYNRHVTDYVMLLIAAEIIRPKSLFVRVDLYSVFPVYVMETNQCRYCRHI